MAGAPFKDDSDAERRFTLLLIALYRDCPELWKVKSKDYFNQNKKHISQQKIVDALSQFKPDFTVEKFKKKINTLRTNFNKDFKAIENAKRSGASIDEIPNPKTWYFDDMLFIKDQLDVAETESSERQTDPPRKKARKLNEPEDLISLARKHLEQPQTDYDKIASAWAVELQKMKPQQQLFAKKAINDILFEGQMGTLHRDSVEINSLSRTSTAYSIMHSSPTS
ncbi:uncharacterized protein LOC143218016 [Lasioglossum baleicum]|uniref:uncharacterized protein LOC143218016 n=1 Tax=Lasioglossum baleicum TaxID=434251 RepID=UPI003FCD70D7